MSRPLAALRHLPPLLALGLAALLPSTTPRAQDERWSADFNLPGIFGRVSSLVEFRSELVAAGPIGAGKGAFVDHVGIFDGTRWRALPGLFSNSHQYPYDVEVHALAVFQNDLIVAGRFTSVGQATNAWGVARFDGTRWWSLGGGFVGAADVNALAVYNGQLFAGGSMGIQRWNGTSWSQVGGTMQFPADGVMAMKPANDGTLWVSGDFTQIGSLVVNGIASWNGTQWRKLGARHPGGGFPSGYPNAIEEFQGRMVVGGGFNEGGNLDGIAAWNGTDFVPIGNLPNDRVAGTVHALKAMPNGLWVGGDFGYAGGVAAFDLARYDGTNWHNEGDDDDGGYSIYSTVFALESWQGKLIVGGRFTVAGNGVGGSRGRPANAIARFDGTSWDSLGEGMGVDGEVQVILPWRGGWLIGGNFGAAGDVRTTALSWFDGRAHHHVADIVGGPVSAIHPWQNGFVISGGFTHVNGIALARAAWFDGTNWLPMGGVSATAFVEYQGQLHASAGGLVVWNGSTWTYLAPMAASHDLVVFQNKLYIAGLRSYFQTDGLLEYDGSTVWAVPNGPNTYARALLVRGNELWVGGDFLQCGTSSVRRLARYDGTRFSQVGPGIAGPAPDLGVWTLAELDGQVYLGGTFSAASGGPGNYVARWDGTAFRALGSGVNSGVTEIVPDPVTGDLLIGGGFFAVRGTSTLSAIPGNKLARYRTRDAFADLGHALAGSGRPAQLSGHGTFTSAATLGWRLVGTPPAAAGVHVLALRRIDLPLLGGLLVPAADATLGFTSSALGTHEFALGLTGTIPVGLPLYVQSWFLDATAPQGLGASNAVSTVSR